MRFTIYISVAIYMLSCKTPSIVATKAMLEGNMANNTQQYEQAIIRYEEYLSASAHLGLYRDFTEEARVCRNLAHAYSTQGRFNNALVYLKKAVQRDSVASNETELLEDYRMLGELYAFKGDYDQSLRVLDKAAQQGKRIQGSVKNKEKSSVAAIDLSMAQVNLSLGNFSEAEKFANRSLMVFKALQDDLGEVEASMLLGIIARERNDLTQAVNRLDKVLHRAQELGLNTARQHQALSEVYWLRGDIEKTISLKLAALEESKKSAIKPQMVMANMRLGDVYQKMSDQKKATFYYQQAMSLESAADTSALGTSLKIRMGDEQAVRATYSRSTASLGKAFVSLRLGDMSLQKLNYDSAIFFFRQAEAIFDKLNSHEGLANTRFQLAKVYIEKKDFHNGGILLRGAKSESIQPDLHWQIYYMLGILSEEVKQLDSARYNYEKSIAIIDNLRGNLTVEEFKTLFSNNKVAVYDRLIQLLLNNRSYWKLQTMPVNERAFYLAEQSRSRAFLDMMGNHRIDAKSVKDSVLLEKEQQLRLKIQQLNKEITGGTEKSVIFQLSENLRATQAEHEQVKQQIKLSNPSYAGMVSVDPQPVPDIQGLLDNKTAIVEYWVGDESTVVWVITKKLLQAKVINIPRAALLRQVQGCRNGIARQVEQVTNSTLTELYKNLIQPVLPELKSITNLVIVPHASLHFLPFQALMSSSSRFLIEDFVISYAPSASVWYTCQKRAPGKTEGVLGLALGEKGIGEFSGLPGTEMELQQISRVYADNMQRKVGDEFTETVFKQEASRYGYLHVATHGTFNILQPLYSYLLMHGTSEDDGRLTVEEIFGSDIQGRLVTLSACETGLGELGQGDELVGLSRAFLYAGAPAVVVSLWKVDDSTTAWLMTRLHQYLHAGHRVPEALTYAQRDLININMKVQKSSSRGIGEEVFDPKIVEAVSKRKASRMPYFWSPFVVIGSAL